MKGDTVRPFFRVSPVSQLTDAVHDADCDLFSANGTNAVIFKGLKRIPENPAFAVTVVMIFSFLGKEINSPGKFFRIAVPDGVNNALIAYFRIEHICIASEFFRGMGVGIGDQGEIIEETACPVHGRIGG